MKPQDWGALLILAALSAISSLAGWTVQGWRKDAAIAEIRREHSREREAQAIAAASTITAGLKRGEDLQKQVAAAENERDQATWEKEDAIRRLTVGRRCLDSAAVRVLNRAASLKPSLPEAPGQPVSTDAAFATDTDVGIWIGQCQRSYDTCRGRLQAVSDFYEKDDARE